MVLAASASWACSGSSGPSGNGPTDASTDADLGVDGGRTSSDGSVDVTSGDAAPADATIELNEAEAPATATIHYLGRFDTRDPAGPRFAWPGSAIAATFQGTGIDVALTDTGTDYFMVVVDGAAPVVLPTSGSKTYTLASNLTAGSHTVVLTKRTESLVGVVQFLGFTVHAGALVASPDPFTRRIEYIGDSITCGYGDLGVGPNCSFSAATEDETVAYGALTAANVDAQQTIIAYSGKGMYRDDNGSTTDQMPVLFGLTLADDATSTWGFTTPPPDVVVINLSTNDFATGDPGSAFTQAYVTFLHQVRARYANAYILCTLSPMLGPPDRAIAAGYIESAVQEITSGGDARVGLLPLGSDGGPTTAADGGSDWGFEPEVSTDGYGCDYHPSVTTHAKMAVPLTAQIRRLTGW